jgi:sulfite exporter TauE/SafE
MEFANIHTPGAAFVAGLVTSFHCAAMCGPLACWLRPTRAEDDPTTVFTTYQGARLLSYTMLGAAVGALGKAPLVWLGSNTSHGLGWLMVGFFLLVALRLDHRFKKPLVAVRARFRLHEWVRGRSSFFTAGIIGFATPLMPCGPLYFVAALAALSGDAVKGAEFMLSFGLGTLPLLWFAQAHFSWLRTRVPAIWLTRLQSSLALAAALVISWRLRGTLGFAGPGTGDFICF